MERSILDEFLEAYCEPTFGALPKSQIDAFVVRMIQARESKDPIWDLEEKLRI